MLHNYKSYTLILEANSRDKKINKVKEKIKKFINITKVIDWSIDKCITNNSTEGLQYAVWVANQFKEYMLDGILSTTGMDDKSVTKERVLKFFKDPSSDKELEKKLELDWGGLDGIVEGFIDAINEDINYVLDWLKNPLREEKVNLTDLTLKEGKEKSRVWHDSLKSSGKIIDETGKVLIEFDDGYYWINLQTSNSRAEADAMGHCGNTNDGDTLLSLRDKNKSPHVTVAYDTKEGIIYQMKGRNNKKPVEKYHPYIYRLLVDPDLKPKYFAYEYLKEEDFNMSDFDKETFQKVFKYNPDLVYKSIEYDTKMLKGLIEKKYLYKEDVKDILFNIFSRHEDISQDTFMDILDTDIFSKEESKELVKKFKIGSNMTDLVALKLYDNGLITIEELSKKFREIEVISGKTYLVGREDDIDNFMSDSVKTILFGDMMDWWDNGYWYKMESSDQVWDDLKKETKEKVIEKMIGIEINYDGEFENITIEKDMIKWIDKKNHSDGGDFYFVYNGINYEIDLIIDENKDGELEELYGALNRSLNNAQDDANRDEYYKQSKKSLINVLGEFERSIRNIPTYGINKTKEVEVLVFDFHDLCDVSSMVSILEGEYSYRGSISWSDENYGNIWEILSMMNDDKAYINDDYGIYGYIDSETINSYVLEDIYSI